MPQWLLRDLLAHVDPSVLIPLVTFEVHEEVEESLSLEDREKELIEKALKKHKNKRKYWITVTKLAVLMSFTS